MVIQMKYEFALVCISDGGEVAAVNMSPEEAILAVSDKFDDAEVEINERSYVFRAKGTSVRGSSRGELALAVLRAAESKAERGTGKGAR